MFCSNVCFWWISVHSEFSYFCCLNYSLYLIACIHQRFKISNDDHLLHIWTSEIKHWYSTFWNQLYFFFPPREKKSTIFLTYLPIFLANSKKPGHLREKKYRGFGSCGQIKNIPAHSNKLFRNKGISQKSFNLSPTMIKMFEI